MDLRRISDPLTTEQKLTVVTLQDVKAQARVMHSVEDEVIVRHIEAAYDFLAGPEGWTNGFCLLEETFELYAEGFADQLELPVRPFRGEIVSIETRDTQLDAYAAVDPVTYALTQDGDYGLLVRLQPSLARPQTFARDPRRYRIRFKAGHPTPDIVPSGLKQAIRLLAAHWYVNREATIADPRVTSVSRAIQFGLQQTAGRYRVEPDHS